VSYFFTVHKQGDELTVECVAPENVPAGSFAVSGHEDESMTSISIARKDGQEDSALGGGSVIQATAYLKR
jgi:hypothetical protein